MTGLHRTASPGIGNLLSDAEHDMRKVRDLALIVHDRITDQHAPTEDMRHALGWLTGELLEIGERLNDRFDAMHAALVGRRA